MASVVLLRFSLVTSLISSVLGTRDVSAINTENSYSEFVRGNWGRVLVRVVRNCYEASNESHVVSTPCNETELRQIWRYNENEQIVNFYYRLCLTPVNLDGRNPSLSLDTCTGSQEAQMWTVISKSLNDFTIQSSVLQLCLDVNGYAVRQTEIVQLAVCQDHFDDFGRLSDQYLQFAVSYTQIRIITIDAIISQGESARLSCLLQNTPKAPYYAIWTNGVVQIQEFTTKSGYSMSTGIYTNNSMLSILRIDRVAAPESWTCIFIVDTHNFSAVSEVDMPVDCSTRKINQQECDCLLEMAGKDKCWIHLSKKYINKSAVKEKNCSTHQQYCYSSGVISADKQNIQCCKAMICYMHLKKCLS